MTAANLRLDDIRAAVCLMFDIRPADFMLPGRGPSARGARTGRLPEARHCACYLARRLTGRSLVAIGRAFGRDHASVIYGARIHVERMRADPGLAAVTAELERRLRAGAPFGDAPPRLPLPRRARVTLPDREGTDE